MMKIRIRILKKIWIMKENWNMFIEQERTPRQNALVTGSLLKGNRVRHVDWDVA